LAGPTTKVCADVDGAGEGLGDVEGAGRAVAWVAAGGGEAEGTTGEVHPAVNKSHAVNMSAALPRMLPRRRSAHRAGFARRDKSQREPRSRAHAGPVFDVLSGTASLFTVGELE